MQLPVDVKKLIDEMTDIEAARSTGLALSVYVDNKASADLAAHVRSAFASTLPTVRMTLSYLDGLFVPDMDDDMAIIVAGESESVGAAAASIRAVGVPVMIVTDRPAAVEETAARNGHAIPEGDIVAPCEKGATEVAEPITLNEEAAVVLGERMGSWVAAVCRDKRLALAIAFPFMRRSLAADVVQLTALQNAGIGLVPIIPGADLPILTLNQAKMVLQIAAAYGYEMDKDRAKELLAVVGGAYMCRTFARQLVEFVPVLGFAIRPSVAYGGTIAMGYAIIEYFEGGQNVSGVAAAAVQVSGWGTRAVSSVRGAVERIAPVANGAIDKYAPVAEQVIQSISSSTGLLKGCSPKLMGKTAE